MIRWLKRLLAPKKGLGPILKNESSLFGIPPQSYEDARKRALETKPFSIEDLLTALERGYQPRDPLHACDERACTTCRPWRPGGE